MIVLTTLAEAAEVPETDALTVVAIGLTTYVSAAVIHEGIGHEGGCLIGGGRPIGFSLAVAGCEELTPGGARWTTSGGAMANLAFGAGFGTTLALAPPEDGAMHYYLWLNTVVNLWQAGGYLMVGPWLPVGDWGTGGFLQDVDDPLAAQIGLSAAGAGLTFATVPLAQWLGKPLFGVEGTASRRGALLTLVPYFGGSTLIVAGSLIGRAGPEYAVAAAVSTFAGTLFLAYLPLFFGDEVWVPGEPHQGSVKSIRRKPGWWVVGGLVALGGVAILGPGIGEFDVPHPLDPAR